MRLKQYLTDEYKQYKDIEDLAIKIKKNCGSYLNAVKTLDHPFLRAMKPPIKYGNIAFGEKDVRQNRKTRLLSRSLAKTMNKWLESKKGARRDKSVIATSKLRSTHRGFGHPFWIFPVGKLKYSFVMAWDLNISDDLWEPFIFNTWLKNPEKTTFDPEPYFYHNTQIKKAFQNSWEIWFECKKYYYCEPYIKLAKLLGMYWETTE